MERNQNPLARDSELFHGYMRLLDGILGQEEIRAALQDLSLGATQVRMACAAAAGDVLREATAEYADYRGALGGYESALVAERRGNRDAADGVLHRAGKMLGVAGGAATGVGLAAEIFLQPLAFLWRAGLAAVVVGFLAYGAAAARFTELGIRLLGGTAAGTVVGDLDRTRWALLGAVGRHHLLAFVRATINEERRSALSPEFAVVSSPGLSEVYDSAYHVATRVSDEVEELLAWMDGGSIGVAGPRGSGKSTLVVDYCGDSDDPSGDLRCMVAAPVDYVARDFSLHLYATFCRSVRAHLERKESREGFSPIVWLGWLFDALAKLLPWAVAGGALLVYHEGIADLLGRSAAFARGLGMVVLGLGLVRVLLWAVEGRLRIEPDRPTMRAAWGWAATNVARTAARWWVIGAGLWFFREDIADPPAVPDAAVAVLAWGMLAGGALLMSGRVRRTWRAARQSPTRTWRTAKGRRRSRARRLVREAGRNLRRVRYLQTRSSGWTGTFKTPFAVEAQGTGGVQRAEQPLSHPEIVDEFRTFARDVAAFLHEDGHRVFIGVDELDKIGSAPQAEKFLNEIKGIFGIPYVYFLVSVSDDALTAFERRGLPLRDAFDSSFAEIIRVEPLIYVESRRLIYRRVIGLTEPYIALCHCLSGGMARDLIRFARQVVRAGQQGGGIGEICTAVIAAEAYRQIRAAAQVVAAQGDEAGPLAEKLYAIAHRTSAGKPTADLVAEIAEVASAGQVHRDLLAHLSLCATLEDVFGRPLDEPRMLWATAEGDRHPGHFDSLATARLALAHSSSVACGLIDAFRDAWSLPVHPHRPATTPAAAPGTTTGTETAAEAGAATGAEAGAATGTEADRDTGTGASTEASTGASTA